MDGSLNRLQAFFAGRFRKRTAEWFLGGDVAGKAAIQPRGDLVAATLPLDQHHECEEEGRGEIGDFGRQHMFAFVLVLFQLSTFFDSSAESTIAVPV